MDGVDDENLILISNCPEGFPPPTNLARVGIHSNERLPLFHSI